MGKDDRIEALLIEWAQWLMVGDGSGYATMSVLHVDWAPPSPGITPTMKTGGHTDGPIVHRAIGRMSQRLQHTLLVYYCQRLPLAEQALRLDCTISTVHARIDFARKELRRMLFSPASLDQ